MKRESSSESTRAKPSTQRSLAKRSWYAGLQVLCRITFVLVYRIRYGGRRWIPADGGVLVLSSHQSHFDPMLVGMGCNRRLNYLARDSLFGFAPFRWLIHSLDAIPIDREGLGLDGLKETLRRLKRGEMVLMFPEGTRTGDGQVGALKPGFCALAKRTNAYLLPVAIVGAFEAWPRWQTFPRRGHIHVQFGPPLAPEQLTGLDETQLVAEIDRRIRRCHEIATAQVTRGQSQRWSTACAGASEFQPPLE